MCERKKVGLALGSGGARGFCHIGILEVFEKYNIPIDFISGCSMGALVAGCYALGATTEQLKEASAKVSQIAVMDLGFGKARTGLFKGERAMEMVNDIIKDAFFEQTRIPLRITATNITHGTLVTFDSGPIIPAMRASMSIPAIYQAVPDKNGDLLVDGGVIERIPVKALKDIGADIVIAVDALGPVRDNFVPSKGLRNIGDMIERSYLVMDWKNAKENIKEADYVITPDQGDRSIYLFKDNLNSVEAGRIAAENVIDQIKKLLEKDD